jgi:lysophospholipase L1-like esterase
MKRNRRLLLIIGALTTMLVTSMTLNYYLYRKNRSLDWQNQVLQRQSQSHYQRLSRIRLDPLGLSRYSTEPHEQPGASAGRPSLVFFGDSRAASWPAPRVPQFDFLNRGIPGETSAQALARADYHLQPLRPAFVVIQVGVNDLTLIAALPGEREAIVAGCQENIRGIVERATALGANVVLTTIFPNARLTGDDRLYWSDEATAAIQEVNAFLRALEGEDVTVFDAYAILAGDDGEIQPEYRVDLLHINEAGYRRLNEELAPLLLSLAE